MVNSSIVVRKNAPNWPAMVRKTNNKTNNITDKADLNKQSNIAAPANLISKSQSNSSTHIETKIADSMLTKSVESCSRMVRQCAFCQILFTNYHQCMMELSEESS